VCYLAGEFLKALLNNNYESGQLDINEKDILCVQIAGLCHDLGHGPYSHVFDTLVTTRLEGVSKDWKHEDGSVLMFEYMINQPFKDSNLKRVLETDYGFIDEDFMFIKEAILGCPIGEQHLNTDPTTFQFKGRNKDKWFLYEIVNNKFTSIDVDKWDYFARDCHEVGLSYDFDWKQYMSVCRVLYDNDLQRKAICPMDREVMMLYDMFHAREMLHRKALQHVTSVSIELMLADALLEACKVLKSHLDIVSTLKVANETTCQGVVDMSAYEQFDDTILQTVTLCETKLPINPTIESRNVSEILQRIANRDLYTMVGSIAENSDENIVEKWKRNAKGIKEKLTEHLQNERIDENDYIVYVVKFDYGKRNEDPLKLLKAYKKEDEGLDVPKAYPLTAEMNSKMLPSVFEEKHVRLYCKHPSKLDDLKRAFMVWCTKYKLTIHYETTT
jgi:HD superfamily phosphohydrolase